MQVRELYDRFVSPPNRQAADQYEAALKIWEHLTRNPPASHVTFTCIETFRQRCLAEWPMSEQTAGCWRYLRSILIAADRRGVVIPYFHSRG